MYSSNLLVVKSLGYTYADMSHQFPRHPCELYQSALVGYARSFLGYKLNKQ